jgi:hypothetical protein
MIRLPARTAISDVYPNPSNAVARIGFGALWDSTYEHTEAPEKDLASATITDIGGQTTTKLRITGTTSITSLGTNYRGPIFIRFSSALTLVHSSTTLALPKSTNIVTAPGDTCVFVPKGTAGSPDGWVCTSYPPSWAISINGGASEVTSAIDINLNSTSAKVQAINMTVDYRSVVLPDATSLTTGGEIVVIKNTGISQFTVRNFNGLPVAGLSSGQIAAFYLTNNSTSAGTWAVGNESTASFLSSILSGPISTIAGFGSSFANVAVASLSATQVVIAWKGTSTFVQSCVLTVSGVTLTAGAILTVNAVASAYISITALSTTQAVLSYISTATNFVQACTLNVSGTTLTAGTILAVNALAATGTSISMLTATQAVLIYSANVSGNIQACTLNVSGNIDCWDYHICNNDWSFSCCYRNRFILYNCNRRLSR